MARDSEPLDRKDAAMTGWTIEQLDRIAATDELKIATPRRNGSQRWPVPIWVVRHGDALYVRSYRGNDAGWYRGATTHGQGHISAGGVEVDVAFAHVDDEDTQSEIDAAYRDKYSRYGPRFLGPMLAATARDTTLALIPHASNP